MRLSLSGVGKWQLAFQCSDISESKGTLLPDGFVLGLDLVVDLHSEQDLFAARTAAWWYLTLAACAAKHNTAAAEQVLLDWIRL